MNYVFRKLVAFVTLSVITLTVLSPDFTWESLAFDEYDIQNINASALLNISDLQDRAGNTHQDDHTCGCHMFSHLPIQASASSTPSFHKLPETFGFQIDSIYFSPAPDSIDYPPKSSLA